MEVADIGARGPPPHLVTPITHYNYLPPLFYQLSVRPLAPPSPSTRHYWALLRPPALMVLPGSPPGFATRTLNVESFGYLKCTLADHSAEGKTKCGGGH